jgi:hypothetical protein
MSKIPEAVPQSAVPASTADVTTSDYVKQYIDASLVSAGRARFVLLVMVTASVLALLAMWNSRPGNMTLTRVKVATNAQKFYDPNDKKTILPDEQVKPLFTHEGKFDEAAFNSAKHFLDTQTDRFADLDHLKHYIEFLERTRVERIVNVSIPFFGSAFDINDLGMFAGVSFFIILLLFRFSLFRELRNVRLVFKQAKTVEQLELCYNRLTMQQVLTSPPPLDMMAPGETEWGTGLRLRGLFWDNVSRLLFGLPLIAHVLIFLNDWGTYEVRNVYPSIGISLWVSGVFLILNALLTVVSLSLSIKLDNTWWNHARFIVKHRTVVPVDLADEEAEDSPPQLVEPARESMSAGKVVETEPAQRGTNRE